MSLDLDDLERRLDYGDGTLMPTCDQWTADDGCALIAEVRRLRADLAVAKAEPGDVVALPMEQIERMVYSMPDEWGESCDSWPCVSAGGRQVGRFGHFPETSA